MRKDTSFVDHITCTVRDGIKLHARCYRAHAPTGRPVLCLAGLTRNGRDFHDIATYLSTRTQTTRNVYTLDYRGRGHSEWDADWKNYTVPTEANDVIDFLASLSIDHPAIIGTSRGGLITMVLAAMQPSLVGPVVLNDVGPVLEVDGLVRIAGYVGLVPNPRNWDEAAHIVKTNNRRSFPRVTDDEWGEIAHQFYNERDGHPAVSYDPQLKNAFSVLDGPMPSLWPQFEALKNKPVMVLRGENSDILSDATVREMHRRHPTITSHVIQHQGHAPFLRDEQTQGLIANFLMQTDGMTHVQTKNHIETQPQAAHTPAAVKPQPANDDGPTLMNTILSGTTAG